MKYIEKKYLLDKAVAIYNCKKRNPTINLERLSEYLPKVLKDEESFELIHKHSRIWFYENSVFFYIKENKLTYAFEYNDDNFTEDLAEIHLARIRGFAKNDKILNLDLPHTYKCEKYEHVLKQAVDLINNSDMVRYDYERLYKKLDIICKYKFDLETHFDEYSFGNCPHTTFFESEIIFFKKDKKLAYAIKHNDKTTFNKVIEFWDANINTIGRLYRRGGGVLVCA